MTGSWNRATSVLLTGGPGRLLAPVAGSGLVGIVLVRLPGGTTVPPVADRVHLAVLLIAAATTPAVLEPAGSLADATPVCRLLRRSVRTAAVAVAAALAAVVTLVVAPATGHPSAFATLSELAAHVALAAAVAGAVSRWRPGHAAVSAGAAVTALVSVGPSIAGLEQIALDARTTGTGGMLVAAAAATVWFAMACCDPALELRWRQERRLRGPGVRSRGLRT